MTRCNGDAERLDFAWNGWPIVPWGVFDIEHFIRSVSNEYRSPRESLLLRHGGSAIACSPAFDKGTPHRCKRKRGEGGCCCRANLSSDDPSPSANTPLSFRPAPNVEHVLYILCTYIHSHRQMPAKLTVVFAPFTERAIAAESA